MFNRIIYGDSTAIYTIVAFGFAASIFVTISWRAIRMKKPQVEDLANLPFLTATPAAVRCETDSQGLESNSPSEVPSKH